MAAARRDEPSGVALGRRKGLRMTTRTKDAPHAGQAGSRSCRSAGHIQPAGGAVPLSFTAAEGSPRESKGQAGTAKGRKRAAEMVAERWVECCPSKIKHYVSLLEQQHGRRSPGLLNEGPFATNETWPVAESATRMAFCPYVPRKQFPPRFLRPRGSVGALRGVDTSDS